MTFHSVLLLMVTSS